MDINALARKTGSEMIETHISWLLLKEDVYKIKKPLKFSFLDFSTPEKRRFYCQEEVRLNSRLSPEVYLGAVGINEELEFCPIEEGTEYAVRMRRLDEGAKMDRLLKEDSVSEADIMKLAEIVAAFHEKAERTPGYNSADMVSSQVADLGNFRDAIDKASGLGGWVDNLLMRSAKFIGRNRELIEKRRRGFVRDCHGDLHSQNVFFQDGIKIIDCIEFSPEFRCVDVASDIAFMAMDLDYTGKEDLSEIFVNEYAAKAKDDELRLLLPFYKCYRANVRAKIAAIEWMQKPGHQVRERMDRYVMLAEKYSKTLS